MGYNKQSNYLTVIFNLREKKFLAFHFLELWQNVEQNLHTFIKLVTALKLFRDTFGIPVCHHFENQNKSN